MNETHANFLNLNADNRWPQFHWQGLELRPDGALELCSLPALEGDLPEGLAGLAAPDGPAGLAIDAAGTIYFSVPSEHKVLRKDSCDSSVAPLQCAGGEGDGPTQFKTPRGLLVTKHRPALFVADSGHHRVQVFDLVSGQLTAIWGQSGPDDFAPSDRPGQFNTPWTLADDDEGNVYIVDHGNQRVQKFNAAGQVVSAFADNVRQARPDLRPTDIAISNEKSATRIFVLDAVNQVVAVFDPQGHALLGTNGAPLSLPVNLPPNAAGNLLGLALAGSKLWIGDNGGRQVVQFLEQPRLEPTGKAIGYSGPVAALALDLSGGLLIHTGTVMPPLRLSLTKGYRKTGFFWSEAISVGSAGVRWHRACAQVQRPSENERLRLFVFTAQTLEDKPEIQFDAPNPFSAWPWRPRLGPPDPFLHLDDVFVWKGPTRKSSGRDEPTRYLWIGGFLSGDSTATPAVSQLRAEFDHPSYLEHLPAIYRPAPRGDSDGLAANNDVSAGALQLLDSCVTKASKHTFLLRLLSLFEGAFGEVEERIADMATFFDSAAVPREYLGWLAAWFALDLDETWDEARQRQAVAQAFARAGRRGTSMGLREALRVFAGVDAIIEEPILNASCWVLPPAADVRGDCGCRSPNNPPALPADECILGFTTMLAAASPQGAVLGTSATLDRSHLLSGEDFGAPLFEDVAHQVNILVYQGQMCCERTQAIVQSIIDREKPAHVAYQLCLVAPRFRVGFQARVGMDAVVAGPAGPGQLNQSFALNQQATLAPPSHDQPQTRGRVGSIALAG